MFRIFKKKQQYHTKDLTPGVQHIRLAKHRAEALRQIQDERREDVYELLLAITDLRSGVTIRRINPKQNGNLWSSQYRAGRKYYGAGMLEVIDKLTSKDIAYKRKLDRDMRKEFNIGLNKLYTEGKPTDE